MRPVLFLLVWVIVAVLYAQPRVKLTTTGLAVSTEEFWNIQILYDSKPQLSNIRVIGYLNSTVKVYEAVTENFLLQPGLYNFSAQSFNHINILYTDLYSLDSSGVQEIALEITLYDAYSNFPVNSFRTTLRYGSEDKSKHFKDSTLIKGLVSKNVRFNGEAYLSGMYNTREDSIIYTPTDYFRTNLTGTLQVMTIPITASGYVTTEQKHTDQELNTYSIKFDYDQFRATMQQRLQEKVAAILAKKLPADIDFLTESLAQVNDKDDLQNKFGEYKNPDKEDITSLINKGGEAAQKIALAKKAEQLNKYFNIAEGNYSALNDSLQKYQNILHSLDTFNAGSLQQLIPEIIIPTDSAIRSRLPTSLSNVTTEQISKLNANYLTDSLPGMEELYGGLADSIINNSQYSAVSTLSDSTDKYVATYKQLKSMNYTDIDSLMMSANIQQIALSRLDSNTQQRITELLKYTESRDLDDLTDIMGQLQGLKPEELERLDQIYVQYVSLKAQADKLLANETLRSVYEGDAIRETDFDQLLDNPELLSLLDSKFNLLKRYERIMNMFRELEFGTIFPNYSHYSLNGVSLKGAKIGMRINDFHFGVVAGKLSNIYPDTLELQYDIDKGRLFGFKTGYSPGKFSSQINYLYGEKVLRSVDIPLEYKVSNHVVSPVIGVSLFKGKVSLTCEAAFSLTKGENLIYTTGKEKGYAAVFSGNILLAKKTRLFFASQYADPFFTSFGLSYVIRNQWDNEIGVSQQIKTFNITARYKLSQISNTDSLDAEIKVHTVLGQAGYYYKQLLNIHVSVAPSWHLYKNEENRPTKSFFINSNAVVGLNYKVGKTFHSSRVGVNYNTYYRNEAVIDDRGAVQLVYYERQLATIRQVSGAYSVRFTSNTTISTDVLYQNNSGDSTRISRFTKVTMGTTHTFKAPVTIGAKSYVLKGASSTVSYGFIATTAYTFLKRFTIDLMMRYDYYNGIYENQLYSNQNGLYVQSGLRIRI